MECQLCARHVVGTGRQKKVKYGLCLQVIRASVKTEAQICQPKW